MPRLNTAALSILLWISLSTSIGVTAMLETEYCNVYTFVPFTDNGTTETTITSINQTNSASTPNPGFLHMAASLMAMEHFNQRNDSVVPELANLADCSVQFDINRSRMFDSGTSHLASRSLYKAGLPAPCAIAGPYNDLPAIDLSVMAQAAEIPMVIHRSFNIRSILNVFSPYSNQVYPDNEAVAQRLVEFLYTKGRTDYIGILYPFSDAGLQWKDILTMVFQAFNMQTFAQIIFNPNQEYLRERRPATVSENLATLKQRGFRTIVVPMDDPLTTLPMIANAAEEQGMNNGEYFWVWLGDFSASLLYSDNSNVTKLVYGSAYILAIETMFVNVKDDPFHLALTSQGTDFVQRLKAMNPIAPGAPGHFDAPNDFFTSILKCRLEHHGAGFIYDAVMSIGFGACAAQRQGLTTSGGELLGGIRRSDFTGASGNVRFRNSGAFLGGRDGSTVYYGILNLEPGRPDHSMGTFSDVYRPDVAAWEQLDNFTFADGRFVPPELLRDPPSQNYLPLGLQILGFFLFGVVVAAAIGSSIWVYLKRDHPVLRAAQPSFLYVLAFGSAVFSSAIVPMSFDESYGWTEEQLSAGCMAVPWLVGFGHIITYSGLFAKLWRVQRVLQFSRRTIEIRHVVWPAAIVAVAAFVVLGLWTGLDPVMWVRIEIDPMTGESIGYCSSENTWEFALPLAVLMLTPTILTLVMAWKTKDVDEAFSESWWIFALILVQIELVIVAAPVVTILRTVSTSGRYIGFTIILWAFPMSTLLLIMLPKCVAYWREVRGITIPRKRGSRGPIRVSGISINSDMKPISLQQRDSTNSEGFVPAATLSSNEAKPSSDVPESAKDWQEQTHAPSSVTKGPSAHFGMTESVQSEDT